MVPVLNQASTKLRTADKAVLTTEKGERKFFKLKIKEVKQGGNLPRITRRTSAVITRTRRILVTRRTRRLITTIQR
jgi:hypothetical protein